MTSRNLYFKLMKEDIKNRLWAVALISLGCFFMYPVVAAFLVGSIEEYEIYEQGLRYYRQEMLMWLSFKNMGTSFIMMITAVICGLSSFSYLNSRSKVDFYHSIPVKREKFFLANYLNGILIWAIPYGISLLVAAIIVVMNGVSGAELWPLVITGYVLNMIYYLLHYSVVVIAAMLTGNIVIGFLGTMVFSFLIPLTVALFQGYFSTFFSTYYQQENSWFEQLYRISPVLEYSYQYSRYYSGMSVWKAALGALVIALIFTGIGCFLYRRRPSEAAGKAMAFAVSRPLVRIPIVIVSAIGLGLFFWGMRSNIGWAIFGLFFGAMISHCVIEVIYHFDFRSLFSCKLQLVGCIAVAMVILLSFRYDLLGYDSYLPKESDVRCAAISINELNGWVSCGSTEKKPDGSYAWNYADGMGWARDHMEYLDIETLLAIASAGVEEEQKNREIQMNPRKRMEAEASRFDFMPGGDDELVTPEREFASYFIICYTLNSGRKVYRCYYCSLETVLGQIDRMIQDEQYLKGAFPLMNRDANDIATVRFREQDEDILLRELTEEQKKELLDVYRREFASLTIEKMKDEYPVGLIRFTTAIDEQAIDWEKTVNLTHSWNDYPHYWNSNFENYDFYPVYPSFTKTLAILKEQGLEIGKYIQDMEIEQMTVSCYLEDKGDTISVKMKDKREIEELKKIMILGRRSYYNNVFETDNIYGQISYVREDEICLESVNFPRGKVPEFVIERLKEQR
ncbi:MAG: DUF6449 domain-containing protein [Brotaphodocola sp.]